MTGTLTVISGPMFSGKSTYLINKSLECEKKIIINHSLDKRYSTNSICTHSRLSTPSISLDNLTDIINTENFEQADNIFIDEAQFFSNLYAVVLNIIKNTNKNLFIAGLLIDFESNVFGELLYLIPLADHHISLKGKCYLCHNPSLFSSKITENKSQIDVGTFNSYQPLCTNHYLNK